MSKHFLILMGIVLGFQSTTAQDIPELIFARYSDSFSEWEFYDDPELEESAGEMTLRWPNNNDWTKWDFRMGEWTGEIQTVWPDKNDEWRLRTEGQLVTMKTRWPGDRSEWRIKEGDEEYILRVRNRQRPEEWDLQLSKEVGEWSVYTEYEGDNRSWLIYSSESASQNLSARVQLAAAFIAIAMSTPNY